MIAATSCTVEPDGFHQHDYRIWTGGWAVATISVHLHTWMAEHAATWPDAKPVDVWRGQRFLSGHDSLDEAWAEYGDGPIPAVECKQTASTHTNGANR